MFHSPVTFIDVHSEQCNPIGVIYVETTNQLTLEANSLGSGMLQVLQILVPIYYLSSPERIVLLDEPDAHLHANWQYVLAQALKQVQNDLGVQIIISTHSIPMIDAAEPSEVVPVQGPTGRIKPLAERAEVDQDIGTSIDNYHLAKAKISGKAVYIEDDDTHILEACDRVLQIGSFLGLDKAANLSEQIPGEENLGKKGRGDKRPFRAKEILDPYLHRKIEVH